MQQGPSCVYLHINSDNKVNLNIETNCISENDQNTYYSEAAFDEIISKDIDMEVETIVDLVNNDNIRVEEGIDTMEKCAHCKSDEVKTNVINVENTSVKNVF